MNDPRALKVDDPVEGFAACRGAMEPSGSSLHRDRRSVRRSLTAIDDCLDALECLHVRDRKPPARSACGAVVDVLLSHGITPSPAVRAARDTYALHEALLDLQEAVLEDVVRLRHKKASG